VGSKLLREEARTLRVQPGEEERRAARCRRAQGFDHGLDARRNNPAGEPLPPAVFVLRDEVGRRRKCIKTAWRLTCKRAKIDGVRIHDLWRKAGSRWTDAGVPLATVQR